MVKKDCPTCTLIEPVIRFLAENAALTLKVYVQDDPTFPANLAGIVDDSSLEYSYQHDIEVVPTLIGLTDASDTASEQSRIYGWDKKQWQSFTGIEDLGAGLVDFKPGCGSKTQDPGMDEVLALRYGKQILQARPVEIAEA